MSQVYGVFGVFEPHSDNPSPYKTCDTIPEVVLVCVRVKPKVCKNWLWHKGIVSAPMCQPIWELGLGFLGLGTKELAKCLCAQRIEFQPPLASKFCQCKGAVPTPLCWEN